ncbi:hypothetical protein [Streptomyces sp. SS]|uniref:hypothetical protein n=1 Tax=Streptomyces sp. SS TaxID=260742 RepID=UPI0002D8A942|nr:hypothetical protein [Streptomyces sp. SS]
MLRLTAPRALATKVTAHAAGTDDARELLLAMGMVTEDTTEPEPTAKVGSDYVSPAQRRVEWTRKAGEMNAAGQTTADIAAALAIDENLAAELVGDWWAGVGR